MRMVASPGLCVIAAVELAGIIAICPVARAADAYRISGVVVNSVTQQPLSQAQVVVVPEEGRSKELEMTTGVDGRFVFDQVPAAVWTLSAARKGFQSQEYGQRSLYTTGAISVVTGPAGASENLIFPLNPPAAIHGKVLDGNGEPVMGAFLQLMVAVPGPRTEFVVRKTVPTDDTGEYRIPDLPPGDCFLFAMVPEPEGSEGFASQYYPNTTDPRAAAPIHLKPGEDFSADFSLRPGHGVSVHIEGVSEAQSELLVLLSDGPRGSQISAGTLGPGSGRTFCNVLPGRYELMIADLRSIYSASKRIEVGTEDLVVSLPFSDPTEVTAKVRLVAGDPNLLKGSLLQMRPPADGRRNIRPLAPDGTAVFPALAAGRYAVDLRAPGVYIKSVTARNARVLDGLVDLPESGAVQLEIVAAGDGARVKGKVRTGDKPVSGLLVVLAPIQPSLNSDDYYAYRSDSDGSFDFRGVRPGDYKAFASSDDQLEYGNRAAIEKYLSQGTLLKAVSNGSVELQLQPLKR